MTQTARTYDCSAAYTAMRPTAAPPPRISVRDGVMLPGGEIDPATGLPVRPRRQSARTQASRMRAEQTRAKADQQAEEARRAQAMGGSTVSVNFALILLAALIFVLGVFTLTRVSQTTALAKTLAETNQQIKSTRGVIEAKREELEDAVERTKIEYRASQELNMVPASSVIPIYLTAPLPATATADASPATVISADAASAAANPAAANTQADLAARPEAQLPPAQKGVIAKPQSLSN